MSEFWEENDELVNVIESESNIFFFGTNERERVILVSLKGILELLPLICSG